MKNENQPGLKDLDECIQMDIDTEGSQPPLELSFRSFAEKARDIIYCIDLIPAPHFTYINPATSRITGYPPAAFFADWALLQKQIQPDDYPLLARMLTEEMEGPTVFRWTRPDQQTVWLEHQVVAIKDAKGKLVRLEGIARDITARKQKEKKLRYLSTYDPVTQLYNRNYFEEKMRYFEDKRFWPLGLIICDLDGLKIVNDTFGHNAGDTLLQKTAKVLKECFRPYDIIARIGGDEFAILLPNAPRMAVEYACRRIRQAIDTHNITHSKPHIAISIGWAVSSQPAINTRELFKVADHNMYRDKLNRRPCNTLTTL